MRRGAARVKKKGQNNIFSSGLPIETARSKAIKSLSERAPDWDDKNLIDIINNSLFLLLIYGLISEEEFGVIWDRVNSWIDYHILGVDNQNLNDYAKQNPPFEDNVVYRWVNHDLEFRFNQIIQELSTLGFITDAEFLLLFERMRQLKDQLLHRALWNREEGYWC